MLSYQCGHVFDWKFLRCELFALGPAAHGKKMHPEEPRHWEDPDGYIRRKSIIHYLVPLYLIRHRLLPPRDFARHAPVPPLDQDPAPLGRRAHDMKHVHRYAVVA